MNWKVVAGFAILGATISLIAGIAGGNPFAVILLRLLLSAFVCGALGAGVIFVLRRFVPELLSRAAAPAESGAGDVDIVIDEDIPLDGESLLGERPASAAPRSEPAAVAEAVERETGELDALAGELPPMSPEPSAEVADLEAPSEAELGADLDVLEGEPQAPSASWEPLGEDVGSLDVLPDMEQPSASGEAPGTLRGAGERARGKVDERMAGQDPVDLAKAVRTFLRKDQEG